MTVSMNCQHCGVLFTTTNQHAKGGRKYCGSACYRARETANGPRKLVEPVKFTCQVCGKGFERDPGELRSYRAKHGKDPLYCSTKCGGVGRRAKPQVCKNCGGLIERKDVGRNRTRTVCSQGCRRELKSKQMLAYNAVKTPKPRPSRHGYVRIYVHKNPREKAVDVYEHRYVMEQSLGRDLLPDETVHHINGIRSDNRIENLELFSSRHGPGQRVADKVAFAVEMLTLYPEFAAEAGYELRKLSPTQAEGQTDVERLFIQSAMGQSV